jgi:hypothetical protein
MNFVIDQLGLPEAWSLQSSGGVSSGGVSLGNCNLEVARFEGGLQAVALGLADLRGGTDRWLRLRRARTYTAIGLTSTRARRCASSPPPKTAYWPWSWAYVRWTRRWGPCRHYRCRQACR